MASSVLRRSRLIVLTVALSCGASPQSLADEAPTEPSGDAPAPDSTVGAPVPEAAVEAPTPEPRVEGGTIRFVEDQCVLESAAPCLSDAGCEPTPTPCPGLYDISLEVTESASTGEKRCALAGKWRRCPSESTCVPVGPIQTDCPTSLTAGHYQVYVRSTGECTVSRETHCPDGARCNPPPPRSIPCPDMLTAAMGTR